MKTFDKLIQEMSETADENIVVYHGGAKIGHRSELAIQKPKKNRFESGIGINTTNNYETAQKYARGSNVVSRLYLTPKLRLADKTILDLNETLDFINTFLTARFKRPVRDDVQKAFDRSGRIFADILVNLSVNYEIGGKQGMYINDFLVEKGVDASLTRQSGDEEWLVLHTTRPVVRIETTIPKEVSLDDYLLPKISEQIHSL